ncbi:hypothetical protein Tco_0107376 [Tanacetum coccineum]
MCSSIVGSDSGIGGGGVGVGIGGGVGVGIDGGVGIGIDGGVGVGIDGGVGVVIDGGVGVGLVATSNIEGNKGLGAPPKTPFHIPKDLFGQAHN